MPRVKPEYKRERRSQIIEAARTCFARDGFHRTTLQDVFAEAGLSAGAVYNYFRSKDELILAIAQDRHEEEAGVLAQGAETQDPMEALRNIADRFIDTYLSDAATEKRLIAIQTWSEAMRSEDILRSVHEGFNVPRGQIAALLKRAQRTGQIDPGLSSDAVARSMIALFYGFILQKLWEPKLNVGTLVPIYERFLNSLKPTKKR